MRVDAGSCRGSKAGGLRSPVGREGAVPDGGLGAASVCSIPPKFQPAWKHHAGQIEPEDNRIPAHSQPSTVAPPTVNSSCQVGPLWPRWPTPNARLLVAAARYAPRLLVPQAAVRRPRT